MNIISKNIRLARTIASMLVLGLIFYGLAWSTEKVLAGDLPNANHPMMFGYYHVAAQYGNFVDDVKDYTNTEIILQNSFLRDDGTNDIAGFNNAFNKTITAGQQIIFAPSIEPATLLDRGLEAARPYWNNIGMIYLSDEPGWDKATTESNISSFKNTLAQKGLAQKEIAINYTNNEIMTGNSYQASNLDVVGFEAYVDPSQQNNTNLVANLDSQIDQAKARIGNKKMFIVIQAYNRNGAWTNLNSLQLIQTSPYLKAYNDNNVVGLFLFSYARPGGTKDLGTCISTEHRRIWGAISGSSQPASVSCGTTPTDIPPAPSTDATVGWGGSLAYNPVNNTWLVTSGAVDGVSARIMRNDGSAQTPEFKIAPGGAEPKPAFAPDLNKYLVVWINFDQSKAIIYGRFLNPDGSFIGAQFKIFQDSDGASFLYPNSILRYDSKNKKFVFIWEYRNPGVGINLITISRTGIPGTVVPVARGGTGSNAPSLAINENNNEYCVAYDKRSDAAPKIATRRIDAATLTVGAESVFSSLAQYAGIVYNSEDRQYLVAWDDYTGSVKGRILNSCNINDSSGSILTLGAGGTQSVAYNSKSKRYAVIVQDGNDFNNTYFILNSSGGRVGSGIAFAGSRSGRGGNFYPVIAANTTDGTFAATSAIDYNPTRFAPNIGPSTEPPPPVENKYAPIGFFDSASCDIIAGWAVDLDTPARSTKIEIYANGPLGSGTKIFSGPTGGLREDVNSALNILGNHGFTVAMPDTMKDGLTHEIWVYGQDSLTNENVSFENNHKVFNSKPCGMITPPPPAPEALVCDPLPDDTNLLLQCNLYNLDHNLPTDHSYDVAPTSPAPEALVCDPLPDDINLLLQCNLEHLYHP